MKSGLVTGEQIRAAGGPWCCCDWQGGELCAVMRLAHLLLLSSGRRLYAYSPGQI